MVSDWLDSLRGWLGQADDYIARLTDAILTPIATRLSSLEGGLVHLTSTILGPIQGQLSRLEEWADSLPDRILSPITDALSSVEGWVGALRDYVGTSITGVLDDVESTVSGLGDRVTSSIRAGLEDVETRVTSLWDTAREALVTGVATIPPISWMLELARQWPDIGRLQDMLRSIGRLGAEGTPSPGVQALLWEAGIVGAALGAPLGLLPIISDIYAAGLGELAKQATAATHRPRLLSPDAAALAWRRSLITAERWREVMARLGYRDDDAEVIASLLDVYLPWGELVELWRRGVISEAAVDWQLSAQGYPPATREWLKQTRDIIPPVQDIIRMAVREVFTPEVAARFGQYEGFPEEFAVWAERQGLSREWAQRYWAAHWELPSIQMGYEMLHRGVISADDLDMLLRALDVMPYWRDKLTKISYSPYTRVDVRRMYQAGVLDRAGVKRAYLDLGYDEERAEALTVWTERAYAPEPTEEAVQERELTKSEVLRYYREQLLTESDARAMLAELGYSTDAIDYHLAYADLQMEEARLKAEAEEARRLRAQERELSKSEVIRLYKSGLITREDASDRLRSLGYYADDVQYLTAQADYELAEEARRETERLRRQQEAAERDLTKSEILSLYSDGLISAQDAQGMLNALGYDDTEAAYLIALEDYRQAKRLQQEQLKLIQLQYQRGLIDYNAAVDRLTDLNLPGATVSRYLLEWETTRPVTARYPTLAQLQAMYGAGLLPEGELREALAEMGYAAKWVDRLVELTRKKVRISE